MTLDMATEEGREIARGPANQCDVGVQPPRYDGVHQMGEDTFDVITTVPGLPDEQLAELAARGVFT